MPLHLDLSGARSSMIANLLKNEQAMPIVAMRKIITLPIDQQLKKKLPVPVAIAVSFLEALQVIDLLEKQDVGLTSHQTDAV